ncbi:hypothetical protein LTR85_000330 [Meristemomyces frigidus]|nr:hypothetical protein LTR85_000330 [Meristemomyces frigidus]
MEEAAEAAFETARMEAQKVPGHLATWVKNVEWADLPNQVKDRIKDHIKEHPKMTACRIVLIIAAFAPGLIVSPALGLLGFSSVGPVAGSVSAGYQSANGATAGFSLLQSVPMAGYGAAAVNGVVTGASAGAVGAVQWLKRKGGDGDMRDERTGDGAQAELLFEQPAETVLKAKL